MKRLITAAAVSAAALLFLAPIAAAGPNGLTALYGNNSSCGGAQDLGTPAGSVNFHRPAAGTINVVWHIEEGRPNATYTVAVLEGFCKYHALGTTTTNDNGVGNLTGSVTVDPASSQFWVYDSTLTGGFASDATQTITLSP
jgi:hypothetical protein